MPRYNIGDRIQYRYEVHKIFQGGFGVVYICYDHQERVPYAIKGFKEEFGLNEKVIERFRREALEWVELERHQNIVRAYYVEVIERRPYIFLEYIAGAEGVGSNLASWISRGRVDYKHSLKFAVHIANGMDYAFRKRKLVHRDLKPQNILVTGDGTAKVTDFGLAKSVMEGGEKIFPSSALSEKKEMSLSVDGSSCGTPPYMPPEQWGNAEKADTRADIYGFGCVLYEMLTGEPPFGHRGSWQKFRRAHLNERPENPKVKNSLVSDAVSTLVMRCLAKAPQARYANFVSLRDELAGIYQREIGEEISFEVGPTALEVEELNNKGIALANLRQFQGQFQEAMARYNRALQLDPRYAAAWVNKGLALYYLGQFQEAIACYDTALQLDPRYADALVNKGVVLDVLGQFQEAVACHDRVLQLNPIDAQAWYNKGVVLVNLGQFQEAIACYDRVLQLDPRYAAAWVNKGVALDHLGRSQEAIACCDRALQLDSRFAQAWYNKGVALARQGQFKQAMECTDRAIEINPGSEVAHRLRAECLDALRRR